MALFLIQGPPASGKSTWVRERRKPGDIVIDFDDIAATISPGVPSHDYPQHLRTVAAAARRAAIDEAIKIANRVNVYYIWAAPTAKALAFYRAKGARIITIDPGRDVVMQRCRDERPAHALPIVDQWYAGAVGAAPGKDLFAW